ncbi:FAD-dependent oxidoreductase [Nocardia terpenica]|nr:FAD-dependent oxidoreductase [Nocardia terpenica]NQE92964.1 hypothetical protein [Nocardia terpenica]
MSLLHLLWLFRLAAQLGADHIHLDAPVRRIGQTGNGVVVETDDATVHGLRAIIATPIPQVVKIDFDPQLPPALARLSRINVGAGTKVIARLPQSHTVGHNSVLGGQYLWAAWRHGDRLTGFVPPMAGAVPDRDLIADPAAAFDVSAAIELRSTTVFRWGEQQYIQGCDAIFAPNEVCGMGPADRTARPGQLRRVARSSWPDNMEGAVRGGERAARETLATL